ncbi:hypothetical protein NM208_g6222 [Fusarium decemcellulare]|uniref:Uncharacterized protein n=1 Tax=Fusarium decemcellulare TaxID=57161 RepID=A0ACC1SDX1_9HYPO|nr:hypothetical protein NM208_g6222 [Fusarium decemcellulare]
MSSPERGAFDKFSELITELQDLIWKHSLEGQPPTAHFAKLNTEVFLPPGCDMSNKTVLECLSQDLQPLDLFRKSPFPVTQYDILLQTCKGSRSAALRYSQSWGPERTIQLYQPDNTRRLADLDRLRDMSTPRGIIGPANRHAEFRPQAILDLPARVVDGSKDLIVLQENWGIATSKFRAHLMYGKLEWGLPIQHPRYLAVPCPPISPRGRGADVRNIKFLFRLRVEVLYILVHPDDYHPDVPGRNHEALRDVVKNRIERLQQPFLRRPGAADLLAQAPDRFWHGKREFYVLGWDEIEKRMLHSWVWRLLTASLEIHGRQPEQTVCDGCEDSDCQHREETYPVMWKIMTWKDHD